MRRFVRLLLPVAVLGLALSLGCTKLPTHDAEPGPLDVATVELSDSIPLEFGDLVAVTTNETFPGWAQLWFQREDSSIVTVYVNYKEQKLEHQALVIPRS